ncbi:hypothetical protein [Paenibacillus sp. QZ-Y1]|uniref:hypothetical protein n=1 Tax=Paenibacillus sp. QZ-Y1 TaxID=3414511 RepID=UPI003F7B3191
MHKSIVENHIYVLEKFRIDTQSEEIPAVFYALKPDDFGQKIKNCATECLRSSIIGVNIDMAHDSATEKKTLLVYLISLTASNKYKVGIP